MSFADADTVAITGCRFNKTAVTSGTNRVNIQINTRTPPATTSTKRFLIAHNQFGDLLASNFGISAVQVLGTASDVQIGHNDYIGAYTAPVVNDQTGIGAVVAMLGYPTSGTAPVGAVIPNGNPLTEVLPSLGSASVSWPQNFSLGHYVQRVGTNPTFPGGTWQGWVIYTDQASGNLVAYKGSGIPRY